MPSSRADRRASAIDEAELDADPLIARRRDRRPRACCAASTIASIRCLPTHAIAAGQQAGEQAAEREPDRERAVRRPHELDRAPAVPEHAEVVAPVDRVAAAA